MGQELTEKMKDALIEVGFGVRKYRDGYRSIETGGRVNSRTLDALLKRDLIWWQSSGGAPQKIIISLTPKGELLFDSLIDDWYAKQRRHGGRR